MIATDAILLYIVPRCIVHRDVVELEPLVVLTTEDVSPVVARRSLALVDQHCMQLISALYTYTHNNYTIFGFLHIFCFKFCSTSPRFLRNLKTMAFK